MKTIIFSPEVQEYYQRTQKIFEYIDMMNIFNRYVNGEATDDVTLAEQMYELDTYMDTCRLYPSRLMIKKQCQPLYEKAACMNFFQSIRNKAFREEQKAYWEAQAV